ncbi:MAG: protein phosphatase 1 regulatory subunit 42 [Ruminococcus sp.]|nr:protein phosphatase 1 regulatory subunit 42 [Ruminococcus sp.]
MKKNILAVMAAVMMVVMGSCGSVSGDGTETAGDWGGESVSVSVTERETSGGTESEEVTSGETESVTSSVTERVTTAETSGETEEMENEHRYEGFFVRTSEDESRTVTIESDVFPYDCEEMYVYISWEDAHYYDVEQYNCIDLGNLVNYPNLKRLRLGGNVYDSKSVTLINCEAAAGLEHLEEIQLSALSWEGDWLAEIGSLKVLKIGQCYDCDSIGLEKLTQVETLRFFRCGMNDLSFVNGMSSLTELSVVQSGINNESFNGVAENCSVKRLTLSENKDSLTDITGVSRFKGLEYLYISELHLEDEEKQVKELREIMPECEITNVVVKIIY